MNKKFNVDEILLSVDEINSDKKYSAYVKLKSKSNNNRIINKDIKMEDNKFGPDEKVDVLVGQKSFNLETEKIIFDAEKSMHNLKEKSSPLVLKNEDILVLRDEIKEEDVINESNLKELENNYIYENELLKTEKVKQQETIKDLIILLDDFKSKKRYSDLDSKIKLYQEDNTLLRKKIFELSEQESRLRLEMAELSLDNKINKNQTQTFIDDTNEEKEKIKQLNNQIDNLSQENTQLQLELLSSNKEKETDIDQKIKFYREENAKIIIDKSDIQKKLEITKTQLLVNEQNKTKLKLALDNLNEILSSSNVETRTFGNINEGFSNKSREEK
jgi:hypothetical protein